MVRRFMFAAASAALFMFAPIAGANAAELNVLAGGPMTDSLHEIGPQFERATGHKLVFLFAGTPELIRQATSGAPFDLGVVPVDVMRDAAARAMFGADDRYFPRRLRRRLQERRAEARCRHARRDETRTVAGAIRHALSGERCRRLCDENVRSSRHRRGR